MMQHDDDFDYEVVVTITPFYYYYYDILMSINGLLSIHILIYIHTIQRYSIPSIYQSLLYLPIVKYNNNNKTCNSQFYNLIIYHY
mmetsp:Transcript_2917/g.2411  ORF Transcript_2917/g.2411 Transcript_2917/m.2411 type:complete len:85 (-) Transcript_2917:107-361(-)